MIVDRDEQLAQLRGICPGATLVSGVDPPLVHLKGLVVEAAGTDHVVDALLSPGARDGYDNRLYYATRLPIERGWGEYPVLASTWWAFSWRGVSSEQSWLDILVGHLDGARTAPASA